MTLQELLANYILDADNQLDLWTKEAGIINPGIFQNPLSTLNLFPDMTTFEPHRDLRLYILGAFGWWSRRQGLLDLQEAGEEE